MRRLNKLFGWMLAAALVLGLNLDLRAASPGRNGHAGRTQAKAKVVATPSIRAGNRVAVRVKPPVARVEVIPVRPGPNALWIPGYWTWNYRLHEWVWVAGYWDLYPLGVTWIPGYWHQNDGLWIWIEGRWLF